MSAPTGHDRTRRSTEEDDDDDPVEKMLNKSGCGELHWAVQVHQYRLPEAIYTHETLC